ncbi:MAG: hypothetical protein Q8Q20_01130 [bacterium]|nr:hypothetical protein [bacterium]
MSVSKRLHYDFYNPGSGDIFSSDPARGFIPPVITSEDSVHGDRSLKIDNTNADGGYMIFQSFPVPVEGRYIFSMYVKALSMGGVVDGNDTCTNTTVNIRLRIYEEDWGDVADTRHITVTPAEGWKRMTISNRSDSPLQVGELYRVETAVSNTERPECYGMGVVLIDAAQFEYAENQSNPTPTSYSYPTSQQELFAYTSTDSLGQEPKTGNFYFTDDAETVYANVQIREEAALPAGAKLKWWLYDTSGDYYDIGSALDSGTISVSHDADNYQIVTQNMSAILSASDPAKTKGLYAVRYELWNSDETEMYDAEHLILGLVERSPYADQDLPDSFFANHIWLGLHFNNEAYDHHGIEATRPPGEYLDLARDLGVKYSREFALIGRDNIEQGVDEDPFFDDYIAALAQRHIFSMPVLPGTSGPNQGWQDFVATAAAHYGDDINEYEVLNEPNTLEAETYYEYLWRAKEAVLANSETVTNRVFGPSRGNVWLDEVLNYDDGTHGTGYSLFDGIAPHHYDRYQYGFRQIPEDGSGTQRVDMDDGFETFLGQLENAAPGGVNTKPLWNSEFGINQPMLYPDTPVVYGVPGWGDNAQIQHWPHMSGSIPLARKLAADAIRVNLYLLSYDFEKGFQFGMFSTQINATAGYHFFSYDNTPNVLAVAYPQMSRLLEGGTFVRRIEKTELQTNGVLETYSRAFIFEAPDLDNPGETRPVVTVFNYDQEFTGAALQDIPINTGDIDVFDMEGNLINVGSGSTFSVNIDMAPIYLVGKNGLSTSQMVAALDQLLPVAPSQPAVSRGSADFMNITITENTEEDVGSYNVYRKLVGGEEGLVGSVDSGEMATVEFQDQPTTGTYQYRVTAVEEGSGLESDYSPYSSSIQFSYRPVLSTIGNQSVSESEELTFLVTGDDSDSASLSFSMFNKPAGASFTDHGNKTATFSWTPDYQQAGEHQFISISVSDGFTSDYELFTITVSNTNRLPSIVSIADKEINENDELEFTVIALDEDADDTVTLDAANLPEGAAFVDNGDRTGTFSWQPDTDQSGVYDGIVFQALDNNGGLDEEAIRITVEDGISGCSSNWVCANWTVCVGSLQTRECVDTNECGSDTGRPDENRACDSSAPNAVDNLDAD